MEREIRFSVGEVLNRTFAIWGRNFVSFTVLVAIVHLPMLAYTAYFLSEPRSEEDQALFTGLMMMGSSVLSFVATAAVLYGVVQQLRGNRPGIGECIGVGLRRLFPVIGVAIAVSLYVGLGLLLLVVPGIIFYCTLWAAVPVAVVERVGIGGALKRSKELTKGNRTAIFGLVLLLGVVGAMVNGVIQIGVGQGHWEALQWSLQGSGILLSTLQAVAAAVGYHVLRAAKEGIGVEELAAVFD